MIALNGFKKVVLLRDPLEVIEAYRRAARVGIGTPIKGMEGKLLDELQDFYYGWIERARSHGNTLIIHYEQVLTQTESLINVMGDWFNVPVKNKVELKKMRYTRA